MSGLDLFLAAAILLAVTLSIRKIRKNRKQGKTCGCDCANCSGCGK